MIINGHLHVKDEGKGKGKVHPRTGHEGPEGEYRYIALVFLKPRYWMGWVVNATPRPLYFQERNPLTHCTGVCVGPRADLGRWGESHPHRCFHLALNSIEFDEIRYGRLLLI